MVGMEPQLPSIDFESENHLGIYIKKIELERRCTRPPKSNSTSGGSQKNSNTKFKSTNNKNMGRKTLKQPRNNKCEAMDDQNLVGLTSHNCPNVFWLLHNETCLLYPSELVVKYDTPDGPQSSKPTSKEKNKYNNNLDTNNNASTEILYKVETQVNEDNKENNTDKDTKELTNNDGYNCRLLA